MAIHDGEFDTSASVVRALLATSMPDVVGSPTELLANSGTSNALWRVRLPDTADLIVRLPRTESAAWSISVEAALLPQLSSLAVAVPEIVHVGAVDESFPHPWLVTRWIDGRDAWSRREAVATDVALAVELAETVAAVRSLDVTAARERRPGDRGGPLSALLVRFDHWLADPHADRLIDVEAVRGLVDEARDVDDAPTARAFQHGDLIPGNVLLAPDGRLGALIDWGSAAVADVAQDLTPAWSMFEGRARAAFLDALAVDDETRLRARTIALEQAVGAVVYYVPRGHVLGDVMRVTLDRIVEDR